MIGDRDSSFINVLLAHPHGDIIVSLDVWIAHGPGERPGLRPVAAYDSRTGATLLLKRIPLRYRNTLCSRVLIALKLLPAPWPQ